MIAVSRLGSDQVPYAVSFAKGYLGRGVDPDCVVAAIEGHRRKMELNGEIPRTFGVFKAPVERAIAGDAVEKLVVQDAPATEDLPEWRRQMQAAWTASAQVYSRSMLEYGDFGRVNREWLKIAAQNGLPEVPRTIEAYEAYFRPKATQVAA